MTDVTREALIDEIEQAIQQSVAVTVSATAGGGVSTTLAQWAGSTGATVRASRCPGFIPQRPLCAFRPIADEEAIRLFELGDRAAATERLRSDLLGHDNIVALAVDDADRLDEASAHLALDLAADGIRLVLGHHHSPSTNPSMDLLLGSLPSVTKIAIPPLDVTETGEMLGDPDRASRAHDATGGNPLAVSLFTDVGFVSIGAAVLERFDRLPPDGQAVATILAASPAPIPLEVLETMGRPWSSHGVPVERSGLAVVGPSGATLRNDKIARVLYEEMTAVRRRFVHAEILANLTDPNDLTEIMHHAVGAGDVERIISVGPRAADLAERLGAWREAVGHLKDVLAYEHSVAEADRPALHAALERCLRSTGS